MRVVVAGVVVLALARGAAADGAAIDAEAPPPDDAANHASVQAAVGAGSDDGATALAELRAEWSGSGVAIGLGARLRWRDRELVRTDWDDAGDWLGVIRRLEVAHRGDRLAGAAGLGRLAPVTQGGVVDGYSTAALLDRRAPGAVARVRGHDLAIDASVDDVTAPTLVAGGIELRLGDGGRWRVGLHAAVDPGADRMDLRASGAIELGTRWTAGPIALGGGVITGTRGDVAAVVRGELAVRRGRFRIAATLEARAYDGLTVAAPYGPLWPVEREQRGMMAGADADDRGVATAVGARLAFDGLGALDLGLRTRGARGDLATARIALPWWKVVQAGGYAAVGVHDAVAAGELRVLWSERWFSAIEAGRGYRRADGDGELRGVWQAAAWFGGTAGW
jgi:hypothetical protein